MTIVESRSIKKIPDRAPTFEVRQLKSTPRWYVRVVWPYGQEQHVAGFASADDAKTWIAGKSEGWLRSRSAALRLADHQNAVSPHRG
jgi:hypothetical protein